MQLISECLSKVANEKWRYIMANGLTSFVHMGMLSAVIMLTVVMILCLYVAAWL